MVGLLPFGMAPSVKLTIFGASNSIDDPVNNNNRTYATQAQGRFKTGLIYANVALAGIGVATANSGFTGTPQPSFDANKAINILTLQFSGGNPGDLTADPATVTPFYNNFVSIAQKWKALGVGAKVVVFSTLGFGCADSATVTNYTNANTLILANNTDFDAVINCGSALAAFQPTTACPLTSITADCNHLSEYGQSFLRDPYITAVNSVF